MNCPHVRTELPDVLRGKASPEVSAEVRAHLARCPACSREAEELLQVFGLLEAQKVTEPAPAYWGSVVPRLQSRIEGRAGRRELPWIPRLLLPASAAILLLIFAVRGLAPDAAEPAGSLGDILAQLPAGELDRLQEQTEWSITDAAAAGEAPSDEEILKEMIPAEERPVLYSHFDIETLVEELSDEESTQLVALLEQRRGMN